MRNTPRKKIDLFRIAAASSLAIAAYCASAEPATAEKSKEVLHFEHTQANMAHDMRGLYNFMIRASRDGLTGITTAQLFANRLEYIRINIRDSLGICRPKVLYKLDGIAFDLKTLRKYDQSSRWLKQNYKNFEQVFRFYFRYFEQECPKYK